MTLAADPLADVARLEGVPSAVNAARDAVDAVLRDRGLRVVQPDESAQALVAAAQASAALASDEDDWYDDEASIEGATVRLYTELVDLSRLIRVSPGQAIARAHAVFGRGVLDDDQLGRVGVDRATADRMSGLNELLTHATTASVITVAGVAHAELVSCHPFRFGSGIIARAVEHMILISGGIDAPAVTVPEMGHRQAGRDRIPDAQAYRAALEQYRMGTAEGVRRWLLHVADAVSRGAELSPLQAR